MTDAEPASSLISAQLQVIIGRQIRVIALTSFRYPFCHLVGDASILKYNMSEMCGPENASSAIGQSRARAGSAVLYRSYGAVALLGHERTGG